MRHATPGDLGNVNQGAERLEDVAVLDSVFPSLVL